MHSIECQFFVNRCISPKILFCLSERRAQPSTKSVIPLFSVTRNWISRATLMFSIYWTVNIKFERHLFVIFATAFQHIEIKKVCFFSDSSIDVRKCLNTKGWNAFVFSIGILEKKTTTKKWCLLLTIHANIVSNNRTISIQTELIISLNNTFCFDVCVVVVWFKIEI